MLRPSQQTDQNINKASTVLCSSSLIMQFNFSDSTKCFSAYILTKHFNERKAMPSNIRKLAEEINYIS